MAETDEVRINWWQIIADLSKKGMTMEVIGGLVNIPVSTLAGYKNLNVEPKHADGERLLMLWRRTMMPALPVVTGSVRNRERSAG